MTDFLGKNLSTKNLVPKARHVAGHIFYWGGVAKNIFGSRAAAYILRLHYYAYRKTIATENDICLIFGPFGRGQS